MNPAEPPIEGNFQCGSVSEFKCFGANESKIVKTPLYGSYAKSGFAPARLGKFFHRKLGLVDPMKKALKNYAGQLIEIDKNSIRRVVDVYSSLLQRISKHSDREIFDFETAV